MFDQIIILGLLILMVGLFIWGRWRYDAIYLGEILFWFGLFGFSLSQSLNNFWLIICPLSMLAMFIFASIPMMDNRSLERRPDYEDYMKKTPALIPSLFK